MNTHKYRNDVEVIDKSTLIGRLIDLPEGTEYYSLGYKEEPNVGDIAYASLFAGKRIGEVTQINPEGFEDVCIINGRYTLISDIQYIITKLPEK